MVHYEFEPFHDDEWTLEMDPASSSSKRWAMESSAVSLPLSKNNSSRW